MTLNDAKTETVRIWLSASQRGLGCSVVIDDSRTEEHDWGWVFWFVPENPELCQQAWPFARYAFDQHSGHSVPVGTKGLEGAIAHLDHLRKLYPDKPD
jgi:hypothetical protein